MKKTVMLAISALALGFSGNANAYDEKALKIGRAHV